MRRRTSTREKEDVKCHSSKKSESSGITVVSFFHPVGIFVGTHH